MNAVNRCLITLLLIALPAVAQNDLVAKLASGQMKPEGLSTNQKDQLLVDMAKRLVSMEAQMNAVRQVLTQQAQQAQNTNTNSTANDDAKERIRKASLIFAEIQKMHTQLKVDQVRSGLDALGKQYPEVVKAKAFRKLSNELQVIGAPAGEFDVERWFQGETTMNHALVTVLVFFETWCPHCQDEMPRLEQLYRKYREQGVNVVGLTKITNSASVTSVIGFISDKNLSLPVARYRGNMAERFGVEGIPAAAIVKGGKIIWRGNPELIKDETLAISVGY